jgi:hypothetical protein
VAAVATAAAPAPFVLNLAPAPPLAQSTYKNGSVWTSWGGNVIAGDAPGEFHLFASYMVEECGLGAWPTNSAVLHGVADNPLGPFAYADTALPVYAHNTQINRAPDGTLLIATIGMSPQGQVANCTHGQGQGQGRGAGGALGHGAELVELHYSSSPAGPWTPVTAPDGGLNLFNGTNPSPFFLPNGTVYVASHDNCGLSISVAPSWRGPFAPAACVMPYDAYGPNTTLTFEDPFLWYDAPANTWRVLLHQYDKANSHVQGPVGGYGQCVGEDPLACAWTLQPYDTPAFTTNVTFADGTALTMARRERPKLYFNATTGAPAILYTAVCAPGSSQCFTLGQPIVQA